MYELMNFGSYVKLFMMVSIVDGFVFVLIDQGFVFFGMYFFRFYLIYIDYMVNLVLLFVNVFMMEKNFVVYFVYNLENLMFIVDFCCVFQELFEYYKCCMLERKKQIFNEFVF